jgi:hypothetical protein
VGPPCQWLERGGSGNDSGEENLGRGLVLASGRIGFPQPFLLFPFLFFVFALKFLFETCKTSDLNFSHTLEFEKKIFWYLKHTRKVLI